MRTARTLTLTKETLAELATDELREVAGGATISDIVRECVSAMVNPCPTRNDPVCHRLSNLMNCLTYDCL